ncbi:MAG TPA: hypothetical protein VK995_01140, partial [Oceanipulchritudo sp.]|nr:hypothetical protein [Oceanipulchritudo sp.]
SGLSRYYTDLADWFDHRIQQEDTAPGSEIMHQPAASLTITNAAKDPSQTSVQTATVMILCLLIGILIIENVRLRKGATRD